MCSGKRKVFIYKENLQQFYIDYQGREANKENVKGDQQEQVKRKVKGFKLKGIEEKPIIFFVFP